MTDEEFDALPCWSDVEGDPTYNTRYHLRHATSDSVRPIVHAQASLSGKFRPTPLNIPPGFSPTPQFIGACDTVWFSSSDEFVSDNQDEQPLPDRASATSVSTSPRLIGTIDGTSFLELVDTRPHSHVDHVQHLARRSKSMQDNPSALISSNTDEWSVYHIGDRMLPRNLLPEPIAKTESGQRGAWIVTPGRPSKSISEIARTLSSRRAEAPSTSHLNEIGPELDNLTLTDSVQLRLRGGADSEDEEYSEKKYAPPSSTLSSLPSIRSTYPSPQEWLQRLSLQGDHATTPFDYSRATRILGLEQGASPGFVSSATLQVPDSSNTRGSGVWSSSETLTNQSLQERMPNYSHLHPSQPRSSAGGEDGELRRCPMVIREEPPPVIRVIQPRSSVSQTVKSNFQELLSDNDLGPPYPGDGGRLPAPPPLVDDSRDPDMDLAPRIVMNPSMPTRSNLPVERFL
ncbi:hypothetical protein COCCADRAFT_7586 [Bipolaris zeicola 26-R-13]|uniref:Uncharacterized protein n=1 Tax=Cochliobolus carbonum (strain 26-R-13) TaxID=930089 RepID=W6XX66_COCC2|nr:uncharacterized protein COCCADRAFT_7586 [Bipolaris zeicola 26-R-13]EUC30348.1 hypothetical protein COCCADRAFT_7586 [Bipolaris zeicola 26-R-13]